MGTVGGSGFITKDISGVLFLDKIVDAFCDISEDFWEFFALFWCEAAKDEIDVTHLFAQIVIRGAETEALKIGGI